jgi:hypothetical protein
MHLDVFEELERTQIDCMPFLTLCESFQDCMRKEKFQFFDVEA